MPGASVSSTTRGTIQVWKYVYWQFRRLPDADGRQQTGNGGNQHSLLQ
jgi:hypothetical protein